MKTQNKLIIVGNERYKSDFNEVLIVVITLLYDNEDDEDGDDGGGDDFGEDDDGGGCDCDADGGDDALDNGCCKA